MLSVSSLTNTICENLSAGLKKINRRWARQPLCSARARGPAQGQARAQGQGEQKNNSGKCPQGSPSGSSRGGETERGRGGDGLDVGPRNVVTSWAPFNYFWISRISLQKVFTNLCQNALKQEVNMKSKSLKNISRVSQEGSALECETTKKLPSQTVSGGFSPRRQHSFHFFTLAPKSLHNGGQQLSK